MLNQEKQIALAKSVDDRKLVPVYDGKELIGWIPKGKLKVKRK